MRITNTSIIPNIIIHPRGNDWNTDAEIYMLFTYSIKIHRESMEGKILQQNVSSYIIEFERI